MRHILRRHTLFRVHTALLFCLAALALGTAPAEAGTLTTVHAFCSDDCYDGEQPSGGLTIDAAGVLYGITQKGGVFGGGTAFELSRDPDKGTWKYHALYNFGGTPSSDLRFIIDTAGNLYGTSSGNPGAVFKLMPGKGQGWTKKVLYKFCHRDSFCSDGFYPTGTLTYVGAESGAPYDGISPLYGTTGGGGKYHYGTVYSLTPTGKKLWHLRVLYTFCKDRHCRNGWQPTGLLLNSASDLYVSTDRGGLQDMGTILKLSATDGKANKGVEAFYRFCAVKDCPDGGAPIGLTSDSVGNLLGNAAVGGPIRIKDRCPRGCGTLYQLAADGSETRRYDFCSMQNCLDGQAPYGKLLLDSLGDLFGVTAYGGGGVGQGIYGDGTVFEFAGGTLQTLHSFCLQSGCSDGDRPQGPLVMDGSGNLFGITQYGGTTANAGTVFELSP